VPPHVRISSLAEATDDFGAKAATLGALIRAGFPVPPGLALRFPASDPDAADLDASVEAAASLGTEPVAVRSSSQLEDQPHRSGAGRFTTVLDVTGVADLERALRRCLADAVGPMGVIVQKMVPADAAGVAFTVNPVTGADEVVIDAVSGLGDRLVSGVVTPQQWIVDDNGPRVLGQDGDRPLDDRTAREVARWAWTVAAELGHPQDVEWAMSDGAFFVLQARPVTTLVAPVPIPIQPPPGYWQREPGHARLPRTPLMMSVLDENAGTAQMTEDFGLLGVMVAVSIGGWHYVSIQPVGAPPPRPGRRPAGPPPAALLPALMLLSGSARRRMRAARRAIRGDLAADVLRRWHEVDKPSLTDREAALRDTDLGALGDAGLAGHVRAAAALARDGVRVHFTVDAPYMLWLAELVFFCRDRLGWSEIRTMELLVGTSDATSEPARALRVLAARPDSDPGFDEALADYQRVFGCRALEAEVAEPTLAESPELLSAMLDRLRDGRYDPEAEAADLRARRQRAATDARRSLRARDRERFDVLLARAAQAYPLRDENVFLTIDAPIALVRYAAQEAGRRLTAAGVLDSVDQAFFCTAEELADAVADLGETSRGADPAEALVERVRRRRGEHRWALEHPGPPSYGEPPPGTPSFRFLPRSVRLPTEAMMWIGEAIVASDASLRPERPAAGEPLTGIPASAGQYTGPARIVHSEADLARIRTGDVLVCPCTRPSWSVIFPALGAIVTDTGGALSHPAIIAREHRLPAVVATAHATALIRDGQRVTVDGRAGTVTVHLDRHADRPDKTRSSTDA
jgi:rifampicin phosphotransferase